MTLREQKEFDEAKQYVEEKGFVRIGWDDYRKVAELVGNYYRDDALFTWMCGGAYDPKLVENIVMASMCAVPDILVYADSLELNAVAVWMAPGFSKMKFFSYMRNGGNAIFKSGGLSLFFRMLKYNNFSSALRSKLTNKKDWFLFLYAVKEESSKDVYSTMLIRPMSEFGWTHRRACYSEMNTLEGIMMLKKAGFQVRVNSNIPGTEVRHFGMML